MLPNKLEYTFLGDTWYVIKIMLTTSLSDHLTAFNQGDPHITMFDGTGITFNGKGEFIVVQAFDSTPTKLCEVQGRTAEAPVPEGKTSFATVFTAFAMQCGTNTVSRIFKS